MFAGPTMNVWEGLQSAPTFEQGTYFEAPGQFLVQIEKCMLKPSQKSGLLFLVEFEVLNSNVATATTHTKRTWCQKMQDLNVAFPAIKSFVYAALGVRATDGEDAAKCAAIDGVIKGIMHLATDAPNALRGAVINVETVQTTTKKNEPFTRHNFSKFDYAANGMSAPDWTALMSQAAQVQAGPAYGAPVAPLGAPPAWARPATPPVPAPAPVAGAWGAPPVPGAWGAPPPPVPVPIAPPPPVAPYPPGSQVSPDGFYYLAPGASAWALIPR